MIKPKSLLELARDLASLDKGRPRQASLRRAVSTAYYAVFHHLTQEASAALLGAEPAMIACGTRWFSHGAMADACALFEQPTVGGALAKEKALAKIGVGKPLQDVCRTFRALQQARHEADYDTSSRRFNRQKAILLVAQAEQLFADWPSTAKDPWRATFLLMLLGGDRVVKTR